MWLAEDRIITTNEKFIPNCATSAYNVKQGLANLEKVLQQKKKKLALEQSRPNPNKKLIARLSAIIASLENTLKNAALAKNKTMHVR